MQTMLRNASQLLVSRIKYRKLPTPVVLASMLFLLLGVSLYWLQWSGQQGIKLGYPQPQVHMGTIPSVIRSQQVINFAATGSGRDLTYAWTVTRQNDASKSLAGSGNRDMANQTATGKNMSYQFPASGMYAVTVKATDALGHSSRTTQTIKVLPVPPIASFVAQVDTFFGYQVTLDASQSQADPGTTLQKYTWSYGDGMTSSTAGALASYYYTNPGTYTITLVVTDATGQRSQPFKQTVTLAASN